MIFNIKWKGILQVQNRLKRMPRFVRMAAHDAIGDVLKETKSRSQELCPKDFGNLRNSNYLVWSGGSSYVGVDVEHNPDFVDNPKKKSVTAGLLSGTHQAVVSREIGRVKSAQSAVGVIGYSAPYADYVHEVEFTNYTTPGTGSKYLQQAINEKFPRLKPILLNRARAALEASLR